ncbi:pectate lyase [Ricinus communis]|uniref:Pectate lyase n=1 Tax=Ricinus communis TaxID=3988 RepID=B9R950_RICCO|nr:pectate lyase [Ricinus communis]EEF52127.1 Pectate lyase precursor, putative [Ricinus communis]|eukprot:XP_002511525.1 pectate lyase [Ricinus communis]
METVKYIKLLVIAFATIIPTLKANIAHFDKVWQQRAKEASHAALQAYHPNPEDIVNHFNKEVAKSLNDFSSTSSQLSQHKRPCHATNPIDRCWRCDANWASNRKKLAGCALGFGRMTTGGKDGDYYVVTDPSDDDLVNPREGTLRYGVIQDRPLWITFAGDMVITLSQELIINSNKTIDGRGANVHISCGAQITIQYARNIIIHGIHIHDIRGGSGGKIRDSETHFGKRTASDGDGISIYGSNNIWIDHVSISNCTDGLIDAIMASTAITISNCHFTRHNTVMLLGGNNKFSADSVMQVTVAFNHFDRKLVQRMPRVRYGLAHVVNNDYTSWEMYAIGGSEHPTIISQGNRFLAPPDPDCKQVTKRNVEPESEWKSWNWRSEGDLMLNGAFFVESGSPIETHGKEEVHAMPGTLVHRLTRYAGALHCKKQKPC